ncbi:hypothetical protein LB506_010658 [Fusarium annulatum]|nr:hypothetical protein LB506_010658 [Fusarium annulatum]
MPGDSQNVFKIYGQIQAPHRQYIITDYPFIIPNPHYIKLPREDPSPDTEQQYASSSEQMKNWLREGFKDMPWHSIDSVTVCDTPDDSNISGAPSDTLATQSSDK